METGYLIGFAVVMITLLLLLVIALLRANKLDNEKWDEWERLQNEPPEPDEDESHLYHPELQSRRSRMQLYGTGAGYASAAESNTHILNMVSVPVELYDSGETTHYGDSHTQSTSSDFDGFGGGGSFGGGGADASFDNSSSE